MLSLMYDRRIWDIICGEIIIYLIFALHSFILFEFSVFSNQLLTFLILIFFTVLISLHIIRIKLVLWRIFLQTILSTNSKAYKFFSHGYFVRIVAICISTIFALKVMLFLALLKTHLIDYIVLSIVVIFLSRGGSLVSENNFSIFRDDVKDILRRYLTLFIISCITAAICAIVNICTISEMKQFDSMSNVLQMAIDSVPSEDFSWPFRVIAKHIYAYDILIEQLCFIPMVGKMFYCIYIMASDGAMTYFSIILMLFGNRSVPRVA